MKILVLGGNGFIGRNIVAKLHAQGAGVLVGSRKYSALEGNCVIHMQTMLRAEDWLPALQGVNVVVNSVGILRERHFQSKRETYEKIHTLAPAALAQACAAPVSYTHLDVYKRQSVSGRSRPLPGSMDVQTKVGGVRDRLGIP